MLSSLPSTREASWRWYNDLQAACTMGTLPYTWQVVEQRLGRRDLFYLMTRLLRRPDVDNDFLFARCREIEEARDGYLDLWAREHGKSSLITFGMTIQDIL